MATIESVWMNSKDTLDINLSSGHSILLPLTGRTNRWRFLHTLMGDCNFIPQTDGERVYWKVGPGITLNEILQTVEG